MEDTNGTSDHTYCRFHENEQSSAVDIALYGCVSHNHSISSTVPDSDHVNFEALSLSNYDSSPSDSDVKFFRRKVLEFKSENDSEDECCSKNGHPTSTRSINESPASLRESKDEFSIFGEFIASEIRNINGKYNQTLAKKKIQDAIFEVQMISLKESEPSNSSTSNFKFM